MITIKNLCKQIKEEIRDAEKYAKDALMVHDTDKVLGDEYYRLANEELKHMESLHNQVVRLINKYRVETGKEPPAEMQARYDYEHELQIDMVKDVKILLSMYKG